MPTILPEMALSMPYKLFQTIFGIFNKSFCKDGCDKILLWKFVVGSYPCCPPLHCVRLLVWDLRRSWSYQILSAVILPLWFMWPSVSMYWISLGWPRFLCFDQLHQLYGFCPKRSPSNLLPFFPEGFFYFCYNFFGVCLIPKTVSTIVLFLQYCVTLYCFNVLHQLMDVILVYLYWTNIFSHPFAIRNLVCPGNTYSMGVI